MTQEAFTIFLGFAAVALIFRFLAGGMDGNRVRKYIEEQGGHLIDSRWTPFGKGWYGEKNDRIYEIRYRDAQGNERQAACKTSLFSGVYLSDDRIVVPAAPQETLSLEEENRQLRAELARLKNEKTS